MANRRKSKPKSPNARRSEAAKAWRGAKAHNIKLTASAIVAIVQAVADGIPLDHAAAAGGIHRSTLRRWLQRAETYATDFEPPADYKVYSRAARMIETARFKYLAQVNKDLNDGDLPISHRRLALDLLVRRGVLRGLGQGIEAEPVEYDPGEEFL
jgi:Helix-turn-helix domain